MPIVPRVSPGPLPNVSVSATTPAAPPASAFGGGAGNVAAGVDLSPLAHEAQSIAQAEATRTKQSVLDDALLQAGVSRQNLTTEFESLRGLNAPAAKEEYRQRWTTIRTQIHDLLPSDDLRAAFDHATVGDTLDVDERLARHSFGQMQQADHDNYLAQRSVWQKDAVANAGDPAALQRVFDDMENGVRAQAARSGENAIATEAEVAQTRSNLHMDVLGELTAQGADLTARDYFKQHEQELVGDQRIHATAAVRETSVRAESQRQADAILFGPKLQDGGTPTDHALAALNHQPPTPDDALAQARKIADPEVRDRTTTRIEQYFEQQDRQRRQQQEASYIDALNRVEKTGRVLSVPPGVWQTFSLAERTGLLGYEKSLTKGEPIETDLNQYYALEQLARSEDPKERQQFMQANLYAHVSDIARPDLDRLAALQDGLRKSDAKANEAIAGLRTRDQIARETFSAAIVAPPPSKADKKREHDAQFLQFNRALDSRIQQYTVDNGKRPAPEDVQRFADDLMIRAATTAGDQRRVFETQPGEHLVFSIRDVPFAEKRRITTYLQQRGLPVTDANVLKLFTRSIDNTVPPGAPNGNP